MSTRIKLRDDDNGRRRFNTLEEAFGPHTSRTIEPMPEPRPRTKASEWAMYVVMVIGLLVIWGFR